MRIIKSGKVFAGILIGMLFLTGCGKQDEALAAYQEDMNAFFYQIASFNDGMNAIDASTPDAKNQLLGYLDQLQAEMTWMAELEVPNQFSAVESLADEADDNMKQAVSLYHQAFESEPYDENAAQAAREYYDRANVRIQYIITILHGEIPDGDGVTYTENNSILGEGYLNKSTDDSEENQDAQNQDATSGEATDNFDTDDTVFYEEPEGEVSE